MKRRQIWMGDETWRAIRERAEEYRRTHPLLSSAGKGLPKGEAGGRPPVMDEMLREVFIKPRNPPRATFRPRPVDEDFKAAQARRWQGRPSKLHDFQEVGALVRRLVPSADRPQRVIQATHGFCVRRVIAPFLLDPDRTPVLASTPRVDLVADYRYGGFWTYVQTSLGDFS